MTKQTSKTSAPARSSNFKSRAAALKAAHAKFGSDAVEGSEFLILEDVTEQGSDVFYWEEVRKSAPKQGNGNGKKGTTPAPETTPPVPASRGKGAAHTSAQDLKRARSLFPKLHADSPYREWILDMLDTKNPLPDYVAHALDLDNTGMTFVPAPKQGKNGKTPAAPAPAPAAPVPAPKQGKNGKTPAPAAPAPAAPAPKQGKGKTPAPAAPAPINADKAGYRATHYKGSDVDALLLDLIAENPGQKVGTYRATWIARDKYYAKLGEKQQKGIMRASIRRLHESGKINWNQTAQTYALPAPASRSRKNGNGNKAQQQQQQQQRTPAPAPAPAPTGSKRKNVRGK